MKKLLSALLAAALALTAFGCAKNNADAETTDETDWNQNASYYGTVEVSAPRDAYNFLTGLSDMASDNAGLRPYAVAVNNYKNCWPQYGLSGADILCEMESDGGITRLLALYADIRDTALIGPIRSLRDQLLDAAYQFDPIVVHIGTSTFVDKHLVTRNFRTLDTNYIPHAVYLDELRGETHAIEHNWFVSPLLIYESLPIAKLKPERNIRMDSAFNFADEGELAALNGGKADKITFDFSHCADGVFRYDELSGKYLKWQFGVKHTDAGSDNAQLAFDNVFVLFADVYNKKDPAFMVEVDYSEGGEGVYLSRGRYERITWKKTAFENNFVFADSSGRELAVNRGSSYIGITRSELADTLIIDDEKVFDR